MIENSDEMIKRWFPNNLLRIATIILCLGVAIGFGGNRVLTYLVETSTTLDFQQVDAKIEAHDARFIVDEKAIYENSNQIKELSNIKGQLSVLDTKISGLKDQLDKMQNSFSYNYNPNHR